MKEQDEIKQEEVDVTLPSEILNQQNDQEDDDSDMPLPETADYKQPNSYNELNERTLLPTAKFFKLFNDCLGKLPYATILKNSNNDQIKLIDLIRFIESKTSDGMKVKEMNTVMSFVATAPLEFVRPLMEIVDSKERQGELWQLK